MSTEQSQKTTALLSFLPILFLIAIDFFTMSLQAQAKAIPHLSLAVLVAQLLSVLVFTKGEICNGQRSRLLKVNLYFLPYWSLWLFISLFSNYHYVLTDLVCLSGIGVTLSIWQQPKDLQMRKSLLMLGTLMGGLGAVIYLLIFIDLPLIYLPQYNPMAQTLLGIILANLLLVIAKNRLQGFIALLPFFMLITLLLNALIVLGILVLASQHIVFPNQLAWGLYFILHLIVMGAIAIHIFYKWKIEYIALLMMSFILMTFPVWASMAYISS
ncbi:hypothetical protein B0186_07365 [Canicola haemoglobinophilus]|uniref:Permease n=1 Tax=Canicola haemoglobinophilus TaxID=733 RepID=A0A1V4B0D0_9PAST|nr:hypothetical protein [Canicola haemoglobinophilus]OOR99642.1 hypothetical protein B0186_07365 [Canicola haemoglobinophilus]STO53507.1 permease [Canicola haemoglobinophilus]STO61094.1 permease [Canicola haemoglobinophilus]STO68041.1 permease [Canicola haemoglobinophilus]